MAEPIAPYTLVVRKDNVVTTAGMAGGSPTPTASSWATTSPRKRGRRSTNIRTALEAAGASLDDVVKVTVFITDIGNFSGMNAVYTEESFG